VSGQQAVLQVVILRDGLLVGTEVFVPGQYTLGSSPDADLRLDDATVAATHATLYFQNGRAAIQDAGSGGVFVNGHRVNACEVRAVDEIACGPFTLKVRVMSKTPTARIPPPADVAAILGGAPPPPPAAPVRAAPQKPAAVPPPPPAQARQGQPPATVVSSRRMSTAPAPAEPVQHRAPHLRPVPIEDVDAETRTESVQLASDFVAGSTAPHPRHDPMNTVPLEGTVSDFLEEAAPYVSAKEAQTAQARPHKATAPVPPPAARAAPAPRAKGHQAARAVPAKDRPLPSVPAANDGKGKAHLFVETYWGDSRRFAGSYGRIDPKKHLVARDDDSSPLPMHGFGFDGEFVFAEQKGEIYRVYIPPGAAVERRAQDGNFYPVQPDGLEVGSGQRRCVTLGTGHALRLSGRDSMVVAYVQPAIPQPFVNPLKGLPWLVLALLALLSSAFAAFIFYFGEIPDNADFNAKTVNPVAVKLIAPPKPEEKKKLEEKVEKLKKPDKKKEEVAKAEPKKPPKEVVQPPPETKKTLKSIEKLAAAGPAMKDLLAAVDKLGSGPGLKNAKNDFKLSGLIGKAPIASAGIGTFGLGGGGGGGMGIKGAELLRGKGGGGIGALGAGNIGKGSVAGTVTHAVSRSIGATGTIDKEAVAKVINSHLNEVSSCYERALLKTPGLAGKIVLEWQITTTGSVGYAKTKSSSMQSPAVESCIINVLKLWHFPAAKGAGVVITYPFMFNSVGY
jgi:hypothetical protein